MVPTLEQETALQYSDTTYRILWRGTEGSTRVGKGEIRETLTLQIVHLLTLNLCDLVKNKMHTLLKQINNFKASKRPMQKYSYLYVKCFWFSSSESVPRENHAHIT